MGKYKKQLKKSEYNLFIVKNVISYEELISDYLL